MRLLPAVALALGLVSAQDALVDFDALGITPAEILATDPEVEAMLAEYEAGLSAQTDSIGLGRSSGMASILAMFGGRQLPPGIQLAQFIVNGQFDTIGFLNALKAALQQQAMAQATVAPQVPSVATLPVAQAASNNRPVNNRPVANNNDEFRNTIGGGGNRPSGNRPSASVASSNTSGASDDELRAMVVGGNNYNYCKICTNDSAADCANAVVEDCGLNNHDGEQDTRVCRMTYKSVWRNGSVQTLYTSRCVQRESCQAAMKQNFVKTYDTPWNQCKPLDRLNRRFTESRCTVCQRLADINNGPNNALMPTSANIFDGVLLTTVQNDPINHLLVSGANPYGQFFATHGSY